MLNFTDPNFWIDILIISIIGLGVFFLTYYLYPPLIRWLKQKRWVGYDIHKTHRPETAESGGIGLSLGIIAGLIALMIIYQGIWQEIFVFLITIIASAIIGLIDDQIRLSSIKKIILMIACGIPLFLANLSGFIHIQNPNLPILGTLQLSIIYPLILPVIIAITTNTVNMLEGYNGEGSGSSSIVFFFMIIGAFILQSVQGVMFGIPIFAACFAFYLYNRYPAKVFPGDIGTLVMGASIGLIAIMGSLEVVMMVALLTQIFNSLYVLASVRGFKESRDIKKKDIWMDNENNIHASDESGAALTLPRVICARGPINEPELVKNIFILVIISGLFAIFTAMAVHWTIYPQSEDYGSTIGITLLISILYILLAWKFPRIREITLMMIAFMLVGTLILYILDLFVVGIDPIVNWFIAFIIAAVFLITIYYLSIRYFWYLIKKMKNKSDYISTAQHQKELNIQTQKLDQKEGSKRQ